MAQSIAVTCQGVSKSFALADQNNAWRLLFGAASGLPVFDALTDVSFDVPKGQFVGILGRNGAGKSTLLRVIGGVHVCDQGQVAVNGAFSGLHELGFAGHSDLTGRQYAERLLMVNGFEKSEQAAMIADIHDFSELEDRFDDPVLTYSAGMSARLFFSTATAGHYDVYLLDEVLSVGDQHFRSKCWRRLRDRVSGGASGILVTHDWAAVVKLCETAHVLDKGRIIFTGPAEKAARHYLYGESAKENLHTGVARFVGMPQFPARPRPGEDFILTTEVEIETAAKVGAVMVIERLQPGFGWETALMSREMTTVGEEPGRYEVKITVPHLPLEPGSYQISLHLAIPDPEFPGRRVALDGFGWLSGTGLPIEVTGEPGQGLALASRWEVKSQ